MERFFTSLKDGDIDLAFYAVWPLLWKIILALIIFFVGRKVIHWVVDLIKKGCSRKLDAGVTNFLASICNIALQIILILIIADWFGIQTTSFIALLGSAGLAVGLSLQGSLANFAGGVLILINKPFHIGDYIVVNGMEGTVTEVGICYTKLLTVDNKVVVLPNGGLSNSNLTNVSAKPTRRVDMVVPIAYEDDIRDVKAMLQKLAAQETMLLPGEPVDIFVKDFGADSINMGFRVWVKSEDYWNALFKIQEDVRYAMKENGFTIPFRQMDVTVKTEGK